MQSLRLNRLRNRLILYIVFAVLPLVVLSSWLTHKVLEQDLRLTRAAALVGAQRIARGGEEMGEPQIPWAVYGPEGRVLAGGGIGFPPQMRSGLGAEPQVLMIEDRQGNPRYYGFAPLPEGRGSVLVRSEEGGRTVERAVLWALTPAATLLGLALALFALRRFVVRPIERLALRMTVEGGERSRAQRKAAVLPDELRAIEMRVNSMMTRINTHNTRLQKNVDQKNTLLRELHHRVRNNLQVTSSMLNLRMRRLEEGGEVELLHRFHASLRALATVQDQMFSEGTLAGVEMAEVLRTVTATVKLQRDRDDAIVPVSTRLNPVVLPLDQAMPLALAATESLCDMIGAARRQAGKPGPITITLDEEEGVCEVTLSTPFDGEVPPVPDTTRLIDILVFQLEGHFDESVEGGLFRHRLRFARSAADR